MRKFHIIHSLKTGALLLYETHPSTEFIVLGLIHMQIDIAVRERDAGPRHCSLLVSYTQVIQTGKFLDLMMMMVVVAESCNVIY
jgi:hypothetical protein|uniref:Uncharacterized protein n=1 Tax=Coptotermes formosanus TaxID=36987 RepID=R4ULB2_COPFO|nr:hypothetical protein [Coptotermes formosanus]